MSLPGLCGIILRMRKKTNIFLVGPPGVGKTTIGRQLAAHFGLDFYDLDHKIEANAGADIPWIMDVEGEAGFRTREAKMLENLTQLEGIVLSTGGGAILNENNRARLASRGIVIYLKADLAHLLSRTEKSKHRPLLKQNNRREALETILAVREPLYQALADKVIDTSSHPIRDILAEIIQHIETMTA